ncbi:50S ribosomal protein L16 [SR1 bacterium human oral taxon HOT-345]|nr:50S ribosomal protein L16 [SR1 bacterium human oral taxon HOT-345]RKW23396.1 MAG: 50S ribosomal protein L16 [Candidatus Gracilibacteria bacterium]
MLLTPKKWKYRKQIVPSLKGKSSRGTGISFGEYGLKATTSGYVTNKQLEAARKVLVRETRKVGQLWMRVFPDVPITKKGLEMPMGSGKGDVDIYAAPVRKGKVLFELSGLSRELAEKVIVSAAKKLPIKARFVAKGEIK